MKTFVLLAFLAVAVFGNNIGVKENIEKFVKRLESSINDGTLAEKLGHHDLLLCDEKLTTETMAYEMKLASQKGTLIEFQLETVEVTRITADIVIQVTEFPKLKQLTMKIGRTNNNTENWNVTRMKITEEECDMEDPHEITFLDNLNSAVRQGKADVVDQLVGKAEMKFLECPNSVPTADAKSFFLAHSKHRLTRNQIIHKYHNIILFDTKGYPGMVIRIRMFYPSKEIEDGKIVDVTVMCGDSPKVVRYFETLEKAVQKQDDLKIHKMISDSASLKVCPSSVFKGKSEITSGFLSFKHLAMGVETIEKDSSVFHVKGVIKADHADSYLSSFSVNLRKNEYEELVMDGENELGRCPTSAPPNEEDELDEIAHKVDIARTFVSQLNHALERENNELLRRLVSRTKIYIRPECRKEDVHYSDTMDFFSTYKRYKLVFNRLEKSPHPEKQKSKDFDVFHFVASGIPGFDEIRFQLVHVNDVGKKKRNIYKKTNRARRWEFKRMLDIDDHYGTTPWPTDEERLPQWGTTTWPTPIEDEDLLRRRTTPRAQMSKIWIAQGALELICKPGPVLASPGVSEQPIIQETIETPGVREDVMQFLFQLNRAIQGNSLNHMESLMSPEVAFKSCRGENLNGPEAVSKFILENFGKYYPVEDGSKKLEFKIHEDVHVIIPSRTSDGDTMTLVLAERAVHDYQLKTVVLSSCDYRAFQNDLNFKPKYSKFNL